MEIGTSSRKSLHLHEEIIEEEILPRLPVKSLLRFRCVSKSWGSLIGSKRFIKKHHQNSKNNPSFPQQSIIIYTYLHEWPHQCSLLSALSGPTNTIPSSPLADPTNTTVTSFKIEGCCHGLLCILEEVDEEQIQFHLLNPSTRISKKLPEISNSGFVYNFGFGWVESSDEYKVFVSLVDRRNNFRGCKVYSSKTKSWNTIELCAGVVLCRSMRVFAGGKLYWKNEDETFITFMDLKSEVFGMIELPFDHEEGVLGGFLCVLCYVNFPNKRGFRVWVMQESWEKVMTLDQLLELLQPVPLVVGLKGEILVNCGSFVMVYDRRDNVFRDLKYCEGSCCLGFYTGADPGILLGGPEIFFGI
ncbi:F-box/kelch-repeat protein At3g23880-like [Salvia miltiorrhiza]|uniref:F-box/kelch-repeat protein At3g23880-like n=1 Tax=Salvia miltiorrhiza TaxID=226208 RepID=UPI0025AD8031|nr:F-box/kelch-repeat protein At3g23880-like [Salvia miltiorrhiza]